MESTPSSGSEPLPPPTRRSAVVRTVREPSRSRRVQTFGLGALCGALALSLVVVVTTIFAVSQQPSPLLPDDPAPVAEEQFPMPTPTTPAPTPEPIVIPVEEVDAAPEAGAEPEQPVVQVPPPAPAPAPAPEPTEEGDSAPGNSGSAPGHNKKP